MKKLAVHSISAGRFYSRVATARSLTAEGYDGGISRDYVLLSPPERFIPRWGSWWREFHHFRDPLFELVTE